MKIIDNTLQPRKSAFEIHRDAKAGEVMKVYFTASNTFGYAMKMEDGSSVCLNQGQVYFTRDATEISFLNFEITVVKATLTIE